METAEEPHSCLCVIIFTWKIAGVNLRESMALPHHPAGCCCCWTRFQREKYLQKYQQQLWNAPITFILGAVISRITGFVRCSLGTEPRQLPLCCFFSAPTWTRINRPTHPGFCLPTAAAWLRFRNYAGLYFCGLKLNLSVNKQQVSLRDGEGKDHATGQRKQHQY